MKLEELFLTKKELPILYETCFQIPIHPKLLDPILKINKIIAENIFEKVGKEWSEELRCSPYFHRTLFKELPFKDSHIIQFADNGLVTGFQISRNHGGSIYFDKDDRINCRTVIPNQYIRFSKEKMEEFNFDRTNSYTSVWVYSQTNIDEHSGALFLRNWGIQYMNEVFKEVFK